LFFSLFYTASYTPAFLASVLLQRDLEDESQDPDNSDKQLPDGFSDLFATLAAEMGKVTASDQRERLQILTDRFRREWAKSGLLAKLFDETPADLIDGQMRLKRVMLRKSDGSDVTKMYVHVEKIEHVSEKTDLSKSHEILIAQSLNGLVMPALGGRFDDTDAALVFRQAAELDELRTSGVLPDVFGNFIDMRDPSRSISIRNSADDV
jgi:hypothetical protein